MPSAVAQQQSTVQLLPKRFAVLKQSLVKPEHREQVIQSYQSLVKVLETETARIKEHGSALIPEIEFDVVRKNGGSLPLDFAELVRDRGCVILRGVVSQQQASTWEAQLKDYVRRHPGVGGFPQHRPAGWNIFWTRPQVEMRSHPSVIAAMKCVSRLWHVSDPSTPIDLDSQVVYPDRIRIRYPSQDPDAFPLAPHLDSGATERWVDEEYRKNYAAIFRGDWQDWDGWAADHRVDAKPDLYQTGIACSAWRSLQGWLSLSHTDTGEGTLRLLPNLKASVAYIMLRPLFETEEFDDSLPTFPGAVPGNTQLFPTSEHHPHLALDEAIIGIPPVRPGDYVFWHCDLVHGVDQVHRGQADSSVFYNACNPLTPYNVQSLVSTRASFEAGDVPVDFTRSHKGEREYEHDDCGAKKEHVMCEAGLQALGLLQFDEYEEGITEGQKDVRKLANHMLGL
ncbi:hypothetical protein PFICI_06537 [Pestalotiopsis fici W106-1]|uniref:DUF1479 domain protein n=1 Tax=Pestalotiopsis fici (strain W106-1 / CGMCC3.15140) TaxID=1229662 RepID=W3X659_PESFW|nr:uncharacterized protein PFICI_06537 [Pestalotiopsis fici W106-1]ETS81535.1 hypothetical protein PFICI_06537 [Pestalotiopsis fici W106-1]